MSEIKILNDIDHIILRKNMYIGSTSLEERSQFLFGEYKTVKYVPALIKIIEEILNNSVDEAVRTDFKYANQIHLSIDQMDNVITVEDNGRGLPQGDIKKPDGTLIPAAVAAWTLTKAGSNFDDSQELTVSGQNGVGSSLTNIFSKVFNGVTHNGTHKMVVSCADNNSKLDYKVTPSKVKSGTKVSFIPDFSHFNNASLDNTVISIMCDQLQTLAVTFPKIKFKFNNITVDGNFKKYADQFGVNIQYEDNDLQIAIGSSSEGFQHLSYVNSIHTKVGGVHVDYFMDELTNELIPMIKRKHKIDVTKPRIKENLLLVLIIKGFKNARFDSQTKEKLSVPLSQVKDHINIDFKKLATKLMANDDLLMPIIENALARKLAAEKAANTKAAKQAAKAKVSKHIKANKYSDLSADTSLFLSEGDSAIGYLLSTRNQDLHGGYPLRGKFLNTWGMSASVAMKNQEVFDICAITGLTLGSNDTTMNYQNIVIMVDNDIDGVGSIYPSLLAFFSNWSDLFKDGRIKLLKTPLWICSKGDDTKWYYTDEEYRLDEPNLKGYTSRYIKGLGSLEESEYERAINQPVYEVAKLDNDYKDQFEMLFGKDPNKRKEWMAQ